MITMLASLSLRVWSHRLLFWTVELILNVLPAVSTKKAHGHTPSFSVVSAQPPSSKGAEPSASAGNAGPASLGSVEERGMRSGNLSSTLHKLHLWEKKLYNEVKV